MKNKRLDVLTQLTIKLMRSSNDRELTKLSNELKKLIDTAVKDGTKHYLPPISSKEEFGRVVLFKKEELIEADKGFKKEFIKNKLVTHMVRREHGKGYLCYDIWYRSDNYEIFVTSIDLGEAKQKFLEMAKTENIKRRF